MDKNEAKSKKGFRANKSKGMDKNGAKCKMGFGRVTEIFTGKHSGWSRRDWNPKHQNDWRSLAKKRASDKWKSSKPQGKWKEIAVKMEASGSALKEKTHIWNKSKRQKRDERQEDKERNMLKNTKETPKRNKGEKRGSSIARRNAANLGKSAWEKLGDCIMDEVWKI